MSCFERNDIQMGCGSSQAENLVLDFTHVYCDENMRSGMGLSWLDCSDIEGTNMYCSADAYRELWRRIEPYGVRGIHYIDSGNYHYVTKLMTDHIDEPFSLVLYDHHTDMQPPMAEGMMSCGDWAGLVFAQNRKLRQLVLVGPDEADIEQIYTGRMYMERIREADAPELVTLSARNPESGAALIDMSVPFYLSIDKDVLSSRYAETNWDQGDMSMSTLEKLLDFFLRNGRILGVDICGECQTGQPLPEYFEAVRKNESANKELFDFIRRGIRKK